MLARSSAKALARSVAALKKTTPVAPGTPIRCGVDLGTASVIMVALNPEDRPVACAMQVCQVARDGLVVDYMGAIEIVKRLIATLSKRLGTPLEAAATAVPPGTSLANAGTHRHVIEAAGLEVTAIVDEPTAANAVLGVRNGVVVDIGGGTTGLSVFEDGQVVYVADEATGGTHMSLVLMGRNGISFEQAERLKLDPARATEVQAAVRPVAEKMATIVAGHISGRSVEKVWLVGGSANLQGIEDVFADILGVPVVKPPEPMMVTPLGIALNTKLDQATGGRKKKG